MSNNVKWYLRKEVGFIRNDGLAGVLENCLQMVLTRILYHAEGQVNPTL